MTILLAMTRVDGKLSIFEGNAGAFKTPAEAVQFANNLLDGWATRPSYIKGEVLTTMATVHPTRNKT